MLVLRTYPIVFFRMLIWFLLHVCSLPSCWMWCVEPRLLRHQKHFRGALGLVNINCWSICKPLSICTNTQLVMPVNVFGMWKHVLDCKAFMFHSQNIQHHQFIGSKISDQRFCPCTIIIISQRMHTFIRMPAIMQFHQRITIYIISRRTFRHSMERGPVWPSLWDELYVARHCFTPEGSDAQHASALCSGQEHFAPVVVLPFSEELMLQHCGMEPSCSKPVVVGKPVD